jgi:hypothetical protein
VFPCDYLLFWVNFLRNFHGHHKKLPQMFSTDSSLIAEGWLKCFVLHLTKENQKIHIHRQAGRLAK